VRHHAHGQGDPKPRGQLSARCMADARLAPDGLPPRALAPAASSPQRLLELLPLSTGLLSSLEFSVYVFERCVRRVDPDRTKSLRARTARGRLQHAAACAPRSLAVSSAAPAAAPNHTVPGRASNPDPGPPARFFIARRTAAARPPLRWCHPWQPRQSRDEASHRGGRATSFERQPDGRRADESNQVAGRGSAMPCSGLAEE
jgi:hypothetical protein